MFTVRTERIVACAEYVYRPFSNGSLLVARLGSARSEEHIATIQDVHKMNQAGFRAFGGIEHIFSIRPKRADLGHYVNGHARDAQFIPDAKRYRRHR